MTILTFPIFTVICRAGRFIFKFIFLQTASNATKKSLNQASQVIQDRSIYEDAEIFARNLYDIGKMTERDYTNYVSLFHVMMEYLKPPDLMIYLRANIDTLVKQISKRGRDFEQGIQRSYLETLNALYEDWITRYKLGPLLIIESDNLDFVNNKIDLDYILASVKDHLPQMQLFEWWNLWVISSKI